MSHATLTKDDGLILFKDLKDGEMAVLVGGNYTGEIVVKIADQDCVQILGEDNGYDELSEQIIQCRRLLKGETITVN